MKTLKALRFLPALLWASFIFLLSSQPKVPAPSIGFEGLDKVAHAVVFGILAFALLFADKWPTGKRAWVWCVVASIYGLSDEIHQSFVPPRQADPFDLLADIAGALLVVSLLLRYAKRRKGEVASSAVV